MKDDSSSKGSIDQEYNSTQNFESFKNNNNNILQDEWKDQSEDNGNDTPNKYYYHTSKNDTLHICNFDSGADIPVLHFPFFTNMDDHSVPSSTSLLEDEFNNDDIDYMVKTCYSYKQDIENSSYISPEELMFFMIAPHLMNTIVIMNGATHFLQNKNGHRYFTYQ